MSRTTMIAAFAAVLAASPMALAAQNDTATTKTGSSPAAHTSVTATHIQPGQILADSLKGASVNDAQNKKIASVADLVIDKDGKVAAVVLDADGKNVAVPMQDLKIVMEPNSNKPKTVSIDMSQEQLKSAQAFNLKGDNGGVRTGSSAPPATNTPRH